MVQQLRLAMERRICSWCDQLPQLRARVVYASLSRAPFRQGQEDVRSRCSCTWAQLHSFECLWYTGICI